MTKFMSVLAIVLLVPVLFAGSLAAQTTSEKPKFTIVISAVKPEVPLGSDIAIAITETNISEEPITMESGYHGNMPDGIYYDVRDEHGAEAAKAVYTDGRPSRPSGSRRLGELKPGDHVMTGATISDDYNFNQVGKYTIRAWRPKTRGNPDNSESNRVYSNIITITVVAPVPAPDAAK
jgi:hypothetical protein